MTTNQTTTTTTNIRTTFGFTQAEWMAMHLEIVAEREANAFVESDAVRFFTGDRSFELTKFMKNAEQLFNETETGKNKNAIRILALEMLS